MSGIGLPELIVVALVVALLFGAPILTFFMGYVVGKNRAAAATPEPGTDDQSATPEEPADE